MYKGGDLLARWVGKTQGYLAGGHHSLRISTVLHVKLSRRPRCAAAKARVSRHPHSPTLYLLKTFLKCIYIHTRTGVPKNRCIRNHGGAPLFVVVVVHLDHGAVSLLD